MNKTNPVNRKKEKENVDDDYKSSVVSWRKSVFLPPWLYAYREKLG